MKIISISGLDGSGKSTQINLLKEYFESQGKNVAYFHSVQFSVANILKHFKLNSSRDNGNLNEKSVIKASWLKIQLRKIALFLDIMRFESYSRRLAKKNIDYLLSDRYFYDNIVNIAFLSNDRGILILPNILKPDFAFYLQTDIENIVNRDRVPDQGIEYLRKKKELFDKKYSNWSLHLIDGNRDKEIIHKEIISIIKI